MDCWDCGEPTPIDRDFCRHCGVWLQTSSATAAPRQQPASGLGTTQVALTAESFGPRPLAIERRAIGNRTVLGAGVTLLMAGIVGIAAVYTAITPRSADPLTAAEVPAPSEAAASSGVAPDVDEASLGSTADEVTRALVAAAIDVSPREDPAIVEAAAADVEVVPVAAVSVDEPVPEVAPRVSEPDAAAVVDATATDALPIVEAADQVEPTEMDALLAEPTDVDSHAAEPVEPFGAPIDLPDPWPDPAQQGATSDEPALAPDAPDPAEAPSFTEPTVSGADVKPSVTWRDGWVCDGSLTFADPTGQRWSVQRVAFVPGDGFERVALTMERAGPDKVGPASVTARTYDNASLREQFPNVPAPRSGRNAILLNLADGVGSPLNLRGYRPRGLETLKEFSVFQSPNGSSKLVVGVAGEGCFRLRVPAWNGDGSSGVRQIQLDVKG